MLLERENVSDGLDSIGRRRVRARRRRRTIQNRENGSLRLGRTKDRGQIGIGRSVCFRRSERDLSRRVDVCQRETRGSRHGPDAAMSVVARRTSRRAISPRLVGGAIGVPLDHGAVDEQQQIPNGVARARELNSDHHNQGAQSRIEHLADPRPRSRGPRRAELIRFEHQVGCVSGSTTNVPLGLGERNRRHVR
jgi:hypothetical protein